MEQRDWTLASVIGNVVLAIALLFTLSRGRISDGATDYGSDDVAALIKLAVYFCRSLICPKLQ